MMVGLDGFEPSIAERMMAEGRLPALKGLRERGATVLLDHGSAKRTGLAWEHVATGLSPDGARRWAAVDFDSLSYDAVQRPTRLAPFPAGLDRRTLVFDAPYFALAEAPAVAGLVGWGAHDPGVAQSSRPSGLLGEIETRFGPYPAQEWIYGFVWPWADRAREMSEALVRAVELRGEISEWLFADRLPDWDLGLVVVSEYHSAVEALWHGIDPTHPLHALPSAEPARKGLEGVYEAGDRMLARLVDRFPDARFVVFNLHGMGANDSDAASMLLLPELMYRHSFGKALLRQRDWTRTEAGVPVIGGRGGWEAEMFADLQQSGIAWKLARSLARLRDRLRRAGSDAIPLDWMPAEHYRRFWPRMAAFALPSFYDGRIRINLKGRERKGVVEPKDYGRVCDEIEQLVCDCREPIGGRPVVAAVERSGRPDIAASQADLTIIWTNAPLGLEHPRLGTIGPVPYRRTGGHTGGAGVAYFAGPGIGKGGHGTRSAFDVVPTVIEMLGATMPGLTGRSMVEMLRTPESTAAAAPQVDALV
jgi:predicted AlkP superfamily phosphohydrolase/phosphomutase